MNNFNDIWQARRFVAISQTNKPRAKSEAGTDPVSHTCVTF